MRTVDHLEKDELSAQRKHSLFPIALIALSILENPGIRSYFAGIDVVVQDEFPNSGLGPRAKFLLENVVLAWILS